MLIEKAWSGAGAQPAVGDGRQPLGTGVIGWSNTTRNTNCPADQPITPVPSGWPGGRPTPAPDQAIAISQKNGAPGGTPSHHSR